MANLLYENFGNLPNPMSDLIRRAKEFKKSFNGSPKDEVQRLLNSGQMSQQEFNRLSQIARQVVQAMGEDI
jgi:hypothetical protein